MHIVEQFDDLRAELEPLVSSWQSKLDGIWEGIREVEDTNKRYSYIIECNRFKDLLNRMSFLQKDEIAVHTMEKKIKAIRKELHDHKDDENVGTEIGDLVSKIQSNLESQEPNMNMQKAVSDIKRTINMIKTGECVIPHATKRQLIDRLNKCIVVRNKLLSHPTHGIVIQLREHTGFMHDVAAVCHVQCQECKHFMTFDGNSDGDIYAPIKCTKCKSFDLTHYRVTNREEFDRLDEVAEVVDEKAKPGTTRAEQIRKWQAAFQKPSKKKMCILQ